MSKRKPNQPEITPPSTPEEQIREEVGFDADDGTADEAAVRREGGVNAASVDANRRQKEAVGLKRAGQSRVSFGDDNACNLYDSVIQIWAPATMQILVERLGASKTSYYVTSEPRTGQELYDAINLQIHRRSEESDYKVSFKDKQSKAYRGIGRLTLPNTLGDAYTAPAHHAAPTYGAPPPATHAAPYGYGAPPAASPPPPQPAPAPGDVVGQLLAQVGNLQNQLLAIAQRPSAPAVAPPVAPAAPSASFPGAPPPGAPPPPPGSMIYLQGVGWVKVEGNQPPAPPPAAPPPVSPESHLQSAVDTVRKVTALTRELAPPPAPVPTPPAPPDPGPVSRFQVGEYELIQNTDDGSLRGVETLIANAPKAMAWLGQQQDKWQAAQRKTLELEKANLETKTALAQRERELQHAHEQIIAAHAAIARGEVPNIAPPAPAPPPPAAPPPVAAPAPAPAVSAPHVNGVGRPANGAARVRPPRMAPPSLPGAS